MSQKGERVPFREEWNFPQVLSVYVGLAKTETGTLEEVGLVAEQVSLSMTSTQAALSVIFLSSSSLNFVFSQTLLCLLFTPSSHNPNVLMCTKGKKHEVTWRMGLGTRKVSHFATSLTSASGMMGTLLYMINYVIGDPHWPPGLTFPLPLSS